MLVSLSSSLHIRINVFLNVASSCEANFLKSFQGSVSCFRNWAVVHDRNNNNGLLHNPTGHIVPVPLCEVYSTQSALEETNSCRVDRKIWKGPGQE